MAPCDPYMDAPTLLTVEERLALILDQNDEHASTPNHVSPVKKDLMDLPKELLMHIFSYIHGKCDLAQICKVNRRCFALALPQLYHSLRICTSSTLDPLLAQMFTFENMGLRFVRKVVVHVGCGPHSDPHLAHQWLEMLINLIPKDSLVSFRWNTHRPLPSRLIKLLWQRQRQNERIEIVPRFHQDAEDIEEPDANIDLLAELDNTVFPKLRRVRVALSDSHSAVLACAALRDGSATQLDVDGCHWQGEDAYEDEEDDEGDIQDPLTELLFDHLTKANPHCRPSYDALTSLGLKDINLTLCKHTWMAYLNLSKLQKLSLRYCKGADLFLMQLASATGAGTSGLRVLTFVHDFGTYPDRSVDAIEGILFFPRHTLRTLELCLRNASRLPNTASIRGHSKSLRRLLLDVAKRDVVEVAPNQYVNVPAGQTIQTNTHHNFFIYDKENFTSIIESCTSLVELGLAFPRVNFDYHRFSELDEFRQRIGTIAINLQLATLNVINWPVGYGYGQSEGYYVGKNLQLARLAADIFRNSCYNRATGKFNARRRSTLEVIAFGVLEKAVKVPRPAYFLQSETHVLGRQRQHAESVKLTDLHDNNLDICILNYKGRDFDKASRKSYAVQPGWIAGSNDGDGWEGD